jgi:DNA-binding MarR family transcriptional regulator
LQVTVEDIEVVWAKRQDQIRGALKLLRTLVHAGQRHDSLMQQRSQLTPPQIWALRELDRVPGSRLVDLAKTMSMHVASLKTLAAELETRGLICQSASSSQANSSRYTLAEAGKAALRQSPEPHQGVVSAALEGLSDDEIEALIEALRPLIAALPEIDNTTAFKPLSDIVRHPACQVTYIKQRGAQS